MARTLRGVAFDTELGPMGVVESSDGLVLISIGFDTVEDVRDQLDRSAPGVEFVEHSDAADCLDQYARGARSCFAELGLDDSPLSPFGRQVTQACRDIPLGATVSYGELAARVGVPKAARAIGRVMSKNRWPIVVPCHRVLASNGRIGGFSSPQGLAYKRRLLAHEGVQLAAELEARTARPSLRLFR
jgi:methylated-DNA-[protein]-cysteine S-methyltransferase